MVYNEQGSEFNSTGALWRQLVTSHISRSVWQKRSHTEHLHEDLFHREKKDKDICTTSILKLLIVICVTNSKVQLSKSEKVFAYLLPISVCETTKTLTEKEINSCFKYKYIQYTKGLSMCIYAIHYSRLKRLEFFLHCTLFCRPIKAIQGNSLR